MMKRWWFALPVAMAIAACATWLACEQWHGQADEAPPSWQGAVDSRLLAERRPYSVYLPASYAHAPLRRYPVVYVLDGVSQAAHTAASVALLSRLQVVPEAIVVGIPHPGDASRARDYTPPGMHQDVEAPQGATGGGDRFLAFLREELLPEVESRFRTTATRVLSGWSRGGLFVVYAFAADPGLFQAYIANSPALWRDDGAMLGRLQAALGAQPATRSRLFLSLGDAENEKMKGAFGSAHALLRSGAPASLAWCASTTPGADHSGNPVLATPVGLAWSFDQRAGEDWPPAYCNLPADQNGMSSSGKGSSWRLPGEATAAAGAPRAAPPP